MATTLPNLDWLINDPLDNWEWNYGPALKDKGWEGVWQNFCRLYTYWLYLVPPSMGGMTSKSYTLYEARQHFQVTLHKHGPWHGKRRADVPYIPSFIRWLQMVGKPMDAEILNWYADKMPTLNWKTSYGNPRKLPASSMYLVNGKLMFSNQHQADGPVIMSIHSRGYKNAQMNFLTAPSRRAKKQVLTEYSKYKVPPLGWPSVLPYASTKPLQPQGAFRRWSEYEFAPDAPKLTMSAWNQQMVRNQKEQRRSGWGELTIDPAAPPIYLSIEPQDLFKSGSIWKGDFIPSINYCNDEELPIKYK